MSWNRVISGIVAVAYLVAAFAERGGEGCLKMALFLILPLSCIWFSEAMGGYTGPTTSMAITSPSPGKIVCILGWVVLLLPVVFMIIAYVET